jgi:hypothetical protein
MHCAGFIPQYMSIMIEDGRWTLPEEGEEEEHINLKLANHIRCLGLMSIVNLPLTAITRSLSVPCFNNDKMCSNVFTLFGFFWCAIIYH